MRILILSNHPWRKDNSFGNSYSNIFGKIEGVEIAHIFLLEGIPDYEPNVKRYYQISENEIIKGFFTSRSNKGSGREVTIPIENGKHEIAVKKSALSLYGRLLSFGKRHHWMLLFWMRELAWKYGNINYEGLMDFVRDFKPDMIFLPFANVYNTNRLAIYIKEHYDIPMVAYAAMDHYSLRRVSFNPLFWIDRFMKRAMMRRMIKSIDMLYVISDKLKHELDNSLHVDSKVLYKIPEEGRGGTEYIGGKNYVRFLYTGNIYANRWKTLKLLAEALKKQRFGRLDIYTANPVTRVIDKALNIEGVSSIHKPVSQAEVIELQNDADVLVHVESFDLANKLLVRCAISTKIMDYMCAGRCILAIGPSDVASIEYLKERELALVASNAQGVNAVVGKLKKDEELLSVYANRCKRYVENDLNSRKLRQKLYNELDSIIRDYYKH